MNAATDRYGRLAATFHWVAAALILLMLGSGFAATWGGLPVALQLHLPAGIALLVLTVARIVWALRDRRPPLPAGTPPWQAMVARTTHILLYVVPLGLVVSGMGMVIISDAAAAIFAGDPLPDFDALLLRVPHGLGARLLLALLALHIGAALYHQWVLRDRLLARMRLGA